MSSRLLLGVLWRGGAALRPTPLCVHVQVADVLQLVVQHCPSASDIATLCCLLEVNRPVQAAVRAALGHCSLTMPSIAGPDGSFSTARLAAACCWLPRNAGLVRHLHFGDPALFCDDYSTTPPASCLDTAPHLMTLALQLCATQAQTAAVVAAAAAAPQHQQHHLALLHGAAAAAAAAAALSVPWQLRSAKIHWLASAPMLCALAACTSLTDLQLELRPAASSDSALFRALGSMQHLATLKVRVAEANPLTHSAWLRQLTRLRQLELSNGLTADGFPNLPSSLQHLTAVAGLDGEEELPEVISMSQLVHLQDLQLCVQGVLGSSSVLPPHITRLQVMGEEGGLLPALQGLQQLQELYVHAGDECLPFLQQLSRLRSLRALDVGVDYCDLHEDIQPGQPGQLECLLAGVAAAPQVTQRSAANPGLNLAHVRALGALPRWPAHACSLCAAVLLACVGELACTAVGRAACHVTWGTLAIGF